MSPRTLDEATAREVLGGVQDPEVPVLSIVDLGILREVLVEGEGVVVTITPTYSGCPAIDHIRARIEEALLVTGFDPVEVRTVFSPAWTTDWMSEVGKERLEKYGIAPPRSTAVALVLPVRCPQCGAVDTELVSEFGSTACKALRRCKACLEPFDHFKEF